MDKRYGKDSNAFISPYLRRRLRPLDEVLVTHESQAPRPGDLGAALGPEAMADGLAAAATAASNLDGDTGNRVD